MSIDSVHSFAELQLHAWVASAQQMGVPVEVAQQALLQSMVLAYRDAMLGAMMLGAYGPEARAWAQPAQQLPFAPDDELQDQLRALRAAANSARGGRGQTAPRAHRSERAPNAPRAPRASAPANVSTGPHDGRTPAPGTTTHRKSAANNPPLTNDATQGRSRGTYEQVINQFAVGDNPRYAQKNGSTYCNIFAWDVTRAMGAEIPHWVKKDGSPAQPFEKGANELNANATEKWLAKHGSAHGWKRVSAEEAQAHANEGKPGVAIMAKEGGIGHVSVVRPGEITAKGPAIAQAGARNFNEGHVHDVWRKSAPVQYWVHA